MHRLRLLIALALTVVVLPALAGAAVAEKETKSEAEPPLKPIRTADCVFVPTPNDVVEKMLEMAGVKKTDLLYDPGCGDGRIAVTAARKYGCRAVGFEIDPERVAEARKIVKKRKLEHLVKIEQADIFKLDLSPASVIAIYLLPGMNLKLIPQLEKLKDGSRIVCHDYPIGGMKADKVVTVTSNEDNVKHTIYLYTLPFKKAAAE